MPEFKNPDLRKQAGEIEIAPDRGSDKVLRAGTVKCVHCGCHFYIAPGKTKGRGFCGNCSGYICGAKCLECVPEEKMLDIMEGTVSVTAVSVGGGKPATAIWTP